ncbi:30S ribosomal protein S20 [bacterium]|nr:30S ribosomal protein S20 [bacterium]
MPNVKSAAKRLRQNTKARIRNRDKRSALRTAIKKLRASIAEGNVEQAKAQLPLTISVIDHNARVGIIHKNQAARNASRLTLAVNAMGQEQA